MSRIQMKRTNIHLTVLQIKRLGELSGKTGIGASEHIRRAIDAYLEKQEKKG